MDAFWVPLEVETGRYRAPKTPLQQRIRQLCENSVGDETHFFSHCKPLTLLRVQLYEAASHSLDVNFYSLSPDQETLQLLQLCAESSVASKRMYDMFVLCKRLLEC